MTKCDAVNEESSFLWEYAKLLDFLCLEVSFGRQWGWSLVGACHVYKLGQQKAFSAVFQSAVFQLLCARWFLCQAFSPTTMNTGKGDLSNGEVFFAVNVSSLSITSSSIKTLFSGGEILWDKFDVTIIPQHCHSIASLEITSSLGKHHTLNDKSF